MKYGVAIRGGSGVQAPSACSDGLLFLDASQGQSQSFSGGIMTDGIESTPELFLQLRQITIGFPKIRGPLQVLRIGHEGSAFILLILEHHRQVEMRECGVRHRGTDCTPRRHSTLWRDGMLDEAHHQNQSAARDPGPHADDGLALVLRSAPHHCLLSEQ